MKIIIRKILNRIENYFIYDSFIILIANVNDQFKTDSGVVEKMTEADKIEAVYINAGRNHSARRQSIDSRISQGLDFYTYSINNEIVAFTWVLYNVSRFIDEIAMSIGPIQKSLWVRDIFVLENQRGQNIFSQFLTLIAREFYKGKVESFTSDILQSNQSSFQAHKKYGFHPVFKIKFSILFNRLLIRSLPTTAMKLSIYRKRQSILRINKAYKQYVARKVA